MICDIYNKIEKPCCLAWQPAVLYGRGHVLGHDLGSNQMFYRAFGHSHHHLLL